MTTFIWPLSVWEREDTRNLLSLVCIRSLGYYAIRFVSLSLWKKYRCGLTYFEQFIFKIDKVPLFVILYRNKFLLHVPFYRICYLFHDHILFLKRILYVLLLKHYNYFFSRDVSVAVTWGYRSCLPFTEKICRNAPFVFNYCCRQITMFYNSSDWIHLELQISELKGRWQ